MNMHQKVIQAKQNLLSKEGIILIRQGEHGLCTTYLPKTEKEDGVFAIMMSSGNPARPRWYAFQPFDCYNWEEYFEIID